MLLLAAGLIMMALGLALILWPEKVQDEYFSQDKPEAGDRSGGKEIRAGAVIMIGPIPILLGSDSRTATILMLMALLITAFWALANLRYWLPN